MLRVRQDTRSTGASRRIRVDSTILRILSISSEFDEFCVLTLKSKKNRAIDPASMMFKRLFLNIFLSVQTMNLSRRSNRKYVKNKRSVIGTKSSSCSPLRPKSLDIFGPVTALRISGIESMIE